MTHRSRRACLGLLAAVLAAASPAPASAALPVTGTWYGGSPNEGGVLFEVTRSGGAAVIGRVRYWGFGRTCPGIDTVGTEGRSIPVVVRRGRFVSGRRDGAKVVVSGSARARSITIKATPVIGSRGEIRCFTRTFRARPAGPPLLAAGEWKGTLAEQPPADEFSSPKPAQPFRFRLEEGGRVFIGGGDPFDVALRCKSEVMPSTGYTSDFFDLSRPVTPNGSVVYTNENEDRTVRWTLRRMTETLVEGTLRVTSKNSDGEPCESPEIGLRAERG